MTSSLTSHSGPTKKIHTPATDFADAETSQIGHQPTFSRTTVTKRGGPQAGHSLDLKGVPA